MAAASSGDPGGSGRRIPEFMDPTNQFGELTYLMLTGKNEAPLPKNPFLIGTSVEKVAGGPIEGATSEAQGTRYSLRVRNPSQVARLLKMSTLINGTEVTVIPHPNLNVSRCVISCYEMIDMEEEEIQEGLLSQNVTRVQRITRRENGKSVNTPAIILTFGKCTYPPSIKIGLLRIATRPYYPNPLLCYGCLRYGHPRSRCPGPQRCLNCSAEHHVLENEECQRTAHCINCKGAHRPNSRECPTHKMEKEVIRLKINQNLTYPEARKRIQNGLPNYATAAAQKNSENLKLNELENKMKEKDAQIAQLLDAMKKKDEKIEKLLTHIKNTRMSDHQATQHSGETSLSGTPMNLRSRSPAVSAPMRGESSKKTKRYNKCHNLSPGRQSPPLKKQTADRNMEMGQEPIDVDDEHDIPETPPEQPLRHH